MTPSAEIFLAQNSRSRGFYGKAGLTTDRRGGTGSFRRWNRHGLRLGGFADFERIDPDGLGNVFELGRAEINDR